MKINVTIEAEDCPYWDYEIHKAYHTCHACTCVVKGNTSKNVEYGIMSGGDRYCTLNADIYEAIVESVEKGA